MSTKRPWQPKKVKRVKKHGFLKRMATPNGQNVIKRRRQKGRKILTVSYNGK
jgi:large subunit ribosomal protein L34